MQTTTTKCGMPALAIELEMDPVIFFNHLFRLTAARIVVRGGGISIFRRTRFGVFPSVCPDGGRRIHDPMSGLSTDTNPEHSSLSELIHRFVSNDSVVRALLKWLRL